MTNGTNNTNHSKKDYIVLLWYKRSLRDQSCISRSDSDRLRP